MEQINDLKSKLSTAQDTEDDLLEKIEDLKERLFKAEEQARVKEKEEQSEQPKRGRQRSKTLERPVADMLQEKNEEDTTMMITVSEEGSNRHTTLFGTLGVLSGATRKAVMDEAVDKLSEFTGIDTDEMINYFDEQACSIIIKFTVDPEEITQEDIEQTFYDLVDEVSILLRSSKFE